MDKPRSALRRTLTKPITFGGNNGGGPGGLDANPNSGRQPSPAVSDGMASMIDVMPAAIVVLKQGSLIHEVAGRYASVFGRPASELIGRDLLRYVSRGDTGLVASIINEARTMAQGSVPAGAIARFQQLDDSKRLIEVSVAHRSEGSDGLTVVLLRPQSVRHGLNAVLDPHVGWQDSDELYTAAQLAEDSLITIANVLGCEPVGQECYFLATEGAPGNLIKHSPGEDTPPVDAAGPWDDILAGTSVSSDTDVSTLSPELQSYAGRKRFNMVRCFAVLTPNRHRVAACLVAWDRREGPISPATEATFRYAAEIASLAIGRASTAADSPAVERIRRAVDSDVVTGLGLETELIMSLNEKIEGGERPSIVFVRLTALDSLRQKLGAFTADTIIRVAALRVNSIIRQTDEIFRAGDDAIAIVCGGEIDASRLSEIASRVRTKLSAPFRVDTEAAVHVGVVVGTGQAPEGAIEGEALLQGVVSSLSLSAAH
ncbi:MAG TPA: diguanylate cyclase [Acidimicrobiales bacterium]|jgi:GGDEF domain-containing protein|nr:diguanylate cyclase [Acidimicrobiales bacterium]